MSLTNSGLVDNIAAGDGPDHGGGGIYNAGGTLELARVLLRGNVATGTARPSPAAAAAPSSAPPAS